MAKTKDLAKSSPTTTTTTTTATTANETPRKSKTTNGSSLMNVVPSDASSSNSKKGKKQSSTTESATSTTPSSVTTPSESIAQSSKSAKAITNTTTPTTTITSPPLQEKKQEKKEKKEKKKQTALNTTADTPTATTATTTDTTNQPSKDAKNSKKTSKPNTTPVAPAVSSTPISAPKSIDPELDSLFKVTTTAVAAPKVNLASIVAKAAKAEAQIKKKTTQSAALKFKPRKPATEAPSTSPRQKRSSNEAFEKDTETSATTSTTTTKKSRVEGDNENDDNEEDDEIETDDEEEFDEKLDPHRIERTLFVGNIATGTSKKAITHLFSPYGKVTSVRFRSIAFINPKLDRKVAFARGNFHPDRHIMNAYVVMENKESAEKAEKALNGSVFEGNHLRVDLAANANKKHNYKNCIFVGNLAFTTEEESLWKAFEDCGEIVSVRLIRDPQTNVGKGFGFVAFKDKSSVDLALRLNNIVTIDSRVARVTKAADEEKMKKVKEENILKKANQEKAKQFAILKKKAAKGDKAAKLALTRNGLRPPRFNENDNDSDSRSGSGSGSGSGNTNKFQGEVAVPGSVPSSLKQKRPRRLKKVRSKKVAAAGKN